MTFRKLFNFFAAFALVAAATFTAPTSAAANESAERRASARVQEPVDLAVLVQDDLVSRVGNELGVTRDFIRRLPAGSRVMVGYLTAGTLQVRQQFTDDLEAAARSLRVPRGTAASAPYNPYVEVVEALRKFDESGRNRRVVLLVSDGLDVSRGFDASTVINSIDMERAIREANKRDVTVYSFYAPAVGLSGFNRLAASYGQSALARLTRETGGRAFFQGTDFVTFDAYFERLGRALNGRGETAY
ncbi:MAG TPA: hypothetical protein VK421_04500 [Pyrinomonadaceae bacterium]|nr:hypothetical protein [Pyrinomonadaceae bacterium]